MRAQIKLATGRVCEYQDLQSRVSMSRSYEARRALVQKYAWAIPCWEALAVITKYSPIIEIGAGIGYWARLLQEAGCDILPFDRYASGEEKWNHYTEEGRSWTSVLRGGPNVLYKHPNRTLFLCWPTYNSSFGYECLRAYKGEYFIYVGESQGGCTGDNKFHDLLYDRWKQVEGVVIPQWDGIHDYLEVYRRIPGFSDAVAKRGKMSHGRRNRHTKRMRRP
jgi:hypothetical protein